MTPETAQLANSLSERFRILKETLEELSLDATLYHTALPIHDERSRGVFNALSRILAISDQIHMSLTLLGEDVHALEQATMDPVTSFMRQQLDGAFDEWPMGYPAPAGKVH